MFHLYLNLLDTEEKKSKTEELYHTYKGLMLKIAFDILKDYHLANDALHNAFLKIIHHLSKLNQLPCHKTKAYLVIVIENISKTMYNKRKKQELIFFDELEYELQDHKNLEEEVSNQLTVQYVFEKIKLLPEKYKDILTLRYVNDLSDKAIAERLEISNSAVRKRLERARIKLNELLKKEQT